MPGRTTPLTARLRVDLREQLPKGASPLAQGVDSRGWIGVATRLGEEKPTRHQVLAFADGALTRTEVRDASVVAHFVQPMGEGLLLAGARCLWREGAAEKNAVVVDRGGRVIRRLTLGDGIQDLRVTPSGTIWASYFDEGVFGNSGWGHPGPPCIGQCGLVAFSPEGERVFRYDAERAGTDFICDAYALNVIGDDEVWICFYTDFPIVRICAGIYTVWKNAVAGARAMAVQGDRVLLLCGYGELRNTLQVVKLGADGETERIAEHTLVDENGAALLDAQAQGVGSALHLFHDRRVFVVDDW